MGTKDINPGAEKDPSILSRSVKNFTHSGLGTAATFIISFLFAGLTIRYLGPARAGFFMALAALTGLSGFIGNLGIGTPAIRRIAELNSRAEFPKARAVLGSVTSLSLATSLIVAVPIVFFFSDIFRWSQLDSIYEDDAYWATLCTLGGFVITQISFTLRGGFDALERFGLISILDTTFGLLAGLFGIAALMTIPTMTAIASVRLAVLVIRLGVEVLYTRKLFQGIPWLRWDWSEVRPLLRFGGWVYLGGTGEVLLSRVNSLILTSFLGSAALPFFEIPQRIFRMIHGILGSQSRFLFPMLASFQDRAVDQYKKLEDRLMWLMALASGIFYTGIALVGPDLLGRIVNTEFSFAVKIPLYLACIQGFFKAQDIIPYHGTWSFGWGKPNALYSITSGIVITLTTILLVPSNGYIGASIAQLWVCFFVVFYIVIVRKMIYKNSYNFGFLKTFISPLVMVFVWLFISLSISVYFDYSPVSVYISLLIGLIFGVFVLFKIEKVFFKDKDRVSTLIRILETSLNKVKLYMSTSA